MTIDRKIAALALCTGVFIAATAVYAQTPTALEEAELAGLSPEMRTQVQSRAEGGNSLTEVLQVMLLNNIKAKHLASQIVAMDWARGVAVVEQSGSGLAAVQFDPSTLQIKGQAVGISTGRGRAAAMIGVIDLIATNGGSVLV